MRITLTHTGKLEDACQQLRQVLREKPAYLSARQALAQSLLLQHQFEPATQELKEIPANFTSALRGNE